MKGSNFWLTTMSYGSDLDERCLVNVGDVERGDLGSEVGTPPGRQPRESMRAKEEDASNESICLVSDDLLVSEEIGVYGSRI